MSEGGTERRRLSLRSRCANLSLSLSFSLSRSLSLARALSLSLKDFIHEKGGSENLGMERVKKKSKNVENGVGQHDCTGFRQG